MTREDQYVAALREMDIRLEKGGDLIADMGNVAAVLKKRLAFFWVGFYFVKHDRLVLGPFQGTPACVYLSLENGVCSAGANQKKTILVSDVHQYPGHVACDPNSKSEIVVPVFDARGEVFAVLDVDSDQPGHFDETDKLYLEKVAEKVSGLIG